MDNHKITQHTLDNIKKELNHLVNVERIRIIQELKNARGNGDLSENADYESALEHQKIIEGKIAELQSIINNHVLIKDTDNKGVVKIGSKVRVREREDGSETVYEILGSADNNPQIGRISNECPLAKAILDRKVGDVVEIQNVDLPYTIEILEIF